MNNSIFELKAIKRRRAMFQAKIMTGRQTNENTLRMPFTLIERVPMRRMFLIDIKGSIPPIVQFGRIA